MGWIRLALLLLVCLGIALFYPSPASAGTMLTNVSETSYQLIAYIAIAMIFVISLCLKWKSPAGVIAGIFWVVFLAVIMLKIIINIILAKDSTFFESMSKNDINN
jgi:hypothetical protein